MVCIHAIGARKWASRAAAARAASGTSRSRMRGTDVANCTAKMCLHCVSVERQRDGDWRWSKWFAGRRDGRGASNHYDTVTLGCSSGGACARGDNPLREIVAGAVSGGAEHSRCSGRRRGRCVLGGSLPAVESRRRRDGEEESARGRADEALHSLRVDAVSRERHVGGFHHEKQLSRRRFQRCA